ncbi:MAG: AI-2E family transporter [Ilumatobacter sp.]|nr:AI-2E family transporter [Ilumatobacter sp.]
MNTTGPNGPDADRTTPEPAITADERRLPPWAERASRWAWTFIGVVIAGAMVVLAIAALSEIVVPLIVAVVAAIIFAPLVDRLAARGVPRRLAALLFTLLIVVAAASIVVIVVVAVIDRSDELAEQLDRAWIELSTTIDVPAIQDIIDDIDVNLAATGGTIAEGAGAQVTSFLGSAVGFVAGLVLALVLLYYLLLDGGQFVDRWLNRRPAASRSQARRILTQAAATIRNNARGRTLLAAAQAAFVFVVLLALGVPLPATIAVVNFVGAFVPYLGAFVGGAFAVLMALSEGGTQLALAALVAVVAMNLVLENLLEPRLIGTSIKMHPIIVLIATVAGGAVAGLLGLILAAPAVAIVSNVLRELRATGALPGRPATTPDASPVPGHEH